MGFLTSLFGGENTYVTAALALGIVLVLIMLAVWLIKLVGQAGRNVGRGRNRRLAVIEAVAIDAKRQAIIIRRDDVEHLIVTGGPTDILIEGGFAAPAQPARPQRRSPQQLTGAAPANNDSTEPATEPARRGEPRRASLRHTGLLRPVDNDEPSFAGENGNNRPNGGGDSGRTSGETEETAAGHSDYATEGEGKR